jgi:IclR family acetate operon transcriptional repressor
VRIKQIDKVLDLLELFARQKTPLNLTALSRALGMPKSSTFNLIETLLARGTIYETHPRGGYYPTRRLLDLAQQTMAGDSFLQLIHGELEALAAKSEETVLLAARDPHEAGDIVYIDVVESPALLRYFAKVGDKRPIYTTSSGKAILTTYGPDERRRMLGSLTYTPHRENTITDPGRLAATLDEAEARGWCEDHAEYTPDVMGLAVPILFGERRLGLAVAGPLPRIVANRAKLVELLQSAALRIHALDGR